MSLLLINLICIAMGFFVLHRLYGNQIFSQWRFDWVSLLLSLPMGFFAAAFFAGTIEAAFATEKIELESFSARIFIALYVLICYIGIYHFRQKRNR
jgi:hypothetical protein